MVPKESDNSEDFDPIKFHFEKCCSGLAFLYLWIFSVYQTAQGRRWCTEIVVFWFVKTPAPKIHSAVYHQSFVFEMCVLRESYAFWTVWKVYFEESVWNIYLILYVLVHILYLRLVSGMLEYRDAKVLGGAGSAGVKVFIYKPHWSMILSSPPGKKKKRSLIHSCKIQCPIVLTFLKLLFITLLSFPLWGII